MLDESLRKRLTVLSAPAGSGKTTLLSTWIAGRNPPTAWVSLDQQDNSVPRFWSYLVAALQTLRPGVGALALDMLQSPQPPPVENSLGELLEDLGLIDGDLVLVLDDYHVIGNPSIHSALVFLLDNLPTNTHLVISSRADPPLPLPRWRARRELVEISAADLRFTADEADAFLNQVMSLSMDSPEVAALDKLTEGWIAGLQLAALSLREGGEERERGQGQVDRAAIIRSFSGSHRYVFDYLAQEVLSRQPEDVRRFLVETSILDRLSGPLCDAVARRRDSQTVLETLERGNLFVVPLDQHRRWYRYHHLFREFLQARLAREAEQPVIAELHLRASDWCERNDLRADAVSHALGAREYERAGHLIKRYAGGMFDNNDILTALHWISSLPDEHVRGDPGLSRIYAVGLLATSQMDAVEPRLRDVERALGVVADAAPASLALPADVRGALGEVLAMRANLAFHRQDLPRVLELSRQSIAYLADVEDQGPLGSPKAFQGVATFNMALAYEFGGDIPAATKAFEETLSLSGQTHNQPLIMMSMAHLAQLHVVQGQLRRAAEQCKQALDQDDNPSPLVGLLHTALGGVLYRWNELEGAGTHFEQGIQLGRRWSNWESQLAGYLGLARVREAQGRSAEAATLLDSVTDLERHSTAPWGGSMIGAVRALHAVRQGDVRAAGIWEEKASATLDAGVSFLQEPEAIVLAHVLVRLGSPDEGSRLVDRLLPSAESGKRWERVLELLVVRALALDAGGQTDDALAALARALDLAEPEGYVRVFVDCGEPMRRLLVKAASRTASRHIAIAFARRLLNAFDTEVVGSARSEAGGFEGRAGDRASAPPGSALPEPLSEREREVLAFLASGQTNQEIADRLVLSTNTVKTHVRNLYGKLGARNRTEATARARGLGLL